MQIVSPVPNVIQTILQSRGMNRPDGRALHQWRLIDHEWMLLERQVRSKNLHTLPGAFTLWASECFRRYFPDGDHRRWDFLCNRLNIPTLGPEEKKRLVEDGLRFWRRKLLTASDGRRQRIFTLMVEGGLPEKLLHANTGRLRQIVLNALHDLETRGPKDRGERRDFMEDLARRALSQLSPIYRQEAIAHLLADLCIALVELRQELEGDLRGSALSAKLNDMREDLDARLPLRLSSYVLEGLIKPALEQVRQTPKVMHPIATRELQKHQDGSWRFRLALQEEGMLPKSVFPASPDLKRLLLAPLGALAARGEPIHYIAAREDDYWHLRRSGQQRVTRHDLSIDAAFVLGAYEDGRQVGEVMALAADSAPGEGISLWRADDTEDADNPSRLIPLNGTRTRGRAIWLAAGDIEPVVEGLSATECGSLFQGGRLWRLQGSGSLTIGELSLKLATNAETECEPINLIPFGKYIPGWRVIPDGAPVFWGEPQIYCVRPNGGHLPSAREIKWLDLRGRLAGRRTEWARGTERASLILIALPANTQLALRETVPGTVELQAAGLPIGWTMSLKAEDARASARLGDGATSVSVTCATSLPGEVELELFEPASGRSLRLVSPWPSRNGLLIDPRGRRLEKHQPLAVEALRGWRAIVPGHKKGRLQLKLDQIGGLAREVSGTVELVGQIPLIRTLLALGGPDAQVKLDLEVDGATTHRLEVRRYHDFSKTEGGRLRLGLPRDGKAPQPSGSDDKPAVDLHAADLSGVQETIVRKNRPLLDQNLSDLLGLEGGPWLLQCRADGRVQRALAWSPTPLLPSTRDQRINAYAEQWRKMTALSDDAQCKSWWKVISAVAEGGDAGVADQVQALARVSEAWPMLLLSVPSQQIHLVLSLDNAAPLVWATGSIDSFRAAIKSQFERRLKRYEEAGDTPEEALAQAKDILQRQVGNCLSFRPELAAHFGYALLENGLGDIVFALKEAFGGSEAINQPPLIRLRQLIQDAARRFDRIPAGLPPLNLTRPHSDLGQFDKDLTRMLEAPLVAAECATGRSNPLSTNELFTLISLRVVDPTYFDAALPTAINLLLEETRR